MSAAVRPRKLQPRDGWDRAAADGSGASRRARCAGPSARRRLLAHPDPDLAAARLPAGRSSCCRSCSMLTAQRRQSARCAQVLPRDRGGAADLGRARAARRQRAGRRSRAMLARRAEGQDAGVGRQRLNYERAACAASSWRPAAVSASTGPPAPGARPWRRSTRPGASRRSGRRCDAPPRRYTDLYLLAASTSSATHRTASSGSPPEQAIYPTLLVRTFVDQRHGHADLPAARLPARLSARDAAARAPPTC